MESVYWIARRYDIPFLLIVLKNGGWNAPKVSALLVHKEGLSSQSNRRGELRINRSFPFVARRPRRVESYKRPPCNADMGSLDLNLSFEPSPDYPGIATAAGGAWGATVTTQDQVDKAIQEATGIVRGGRCAVLEVA